MTNLFKTFTDLYISEDKQLEDFIMSNLYHEPVCYGNDSGINMMQMMVARPTCQNQARDKIRYIIDEMNKSKGDTRIILQALKSVLTDEGCAKLLWFLFSNNKEISEQLVDEFIKDGEKNINNFFKGMPRLRVVVKDARKSPDECRHAMDGRYDIYLENIGSGEMKLIDFPTVDSKIIYLWFLLHPQKQFNTTKLRNSIDNISKLNRLAFFRNSDEMAERLKVEKKDKKERDGFEKFWVDHKGKANNAVRKAVGEEDMPEWYTIEKNKEEIALSLPESNIQLPHQLHISGI